MLDLLHKILDELRGALRYRWLAIVVAWTFCLVGWTGVMLLPNMYASTAKLFADTRTALSPVIQGLGIQQDVAAQLNLVQQMLLGERQLGAVVDETGMAGEAATPDQRAKVVARLKSRIEVTMQQSDRNQPGAATYSLSYKDADRDRSLKVVQILLNSFLQDTVSGKLRNSTEAQKFLMGQIDETERRLREAEVRLADFKKRNVGTMPGATGDYFTRLQTEMDAAKQARTDLSVAVSRRDELARQLKDGALLAASSGAVSVPSQGSGGSAPRDTLSQLEEAQAKLDALLRTFTERHPDVGTLREQIANLKAKHERELAALRRGDSGAGLPTGVTSNPVYQSVRLALNEASVEVAALSRQLSSHESKVADLRRLVNSMPEVEAEFARLNRDYDVHKTQYAALVERLEQARLSQDAEETSPGVVLEVVDPPTASLGPVSPKRPLLLSAVLIASLGFAAVMAYVLSKLNPVFNHSRELEQVTGLTVLGAVSLTSLDQYQHSMKRGRLYYAAAAGALVVAFGAVMVLQVKAA